MSREAKRKPPPRYVFVLFDATGTLYNVSTTREEAEDDAWGPRFQPKSTIRVYELVKKRDEP